jgi:hypothetical protein
MQSCHHYSYERSHFDRLSHLYWNNKITLAFHNTFFNFNLLTDTCNDYTVYCKEQIKFILWKISELKHVFSWLICRRGSMYWYFYALHGCQAPTPLIDHPSGYSPTKRFSDENSIYVYVSCSSHLPIQILPPQQNQVTHIIHRVPRYGIGLS